MNEINVYEVVKKLLGNIEPIGETNADTERFENLKNCIFLIGLLIADVEDIAEERERYEYSIRRAGQYAHSFITSLKNE